MHYFAMPAVYFTYKTPYNRTNKFEQEEENGTDPKVFSPEIRPVMIL